MKASKLREQTEEELRQLRGETGKELLELRTKRTGGDSARCPVKVRYLRRDVARIMTIMRERGMT